MQADSHNFGKSAADNFNGISTNGQTVQRHVQKRKACHSPEDNQ